MSKRGRDYFIMSLARELGMTRRRLLLEMDSYEMTMWQAYFKEANKQPEKKQTPQEVAFNLKNAFAMHSKAKKAKRK
jgi:hypothetical protein